MYSVVPSPTGQRAKKAMTDLEYDVSLGHTVEFRCPVQISDCSSLNQLLEFTQGLLEGEGEGNYFSTVRDFKTYKK